MMEQEGQTPLEVHLLHLGPPGTPMVELWAYVLPTSDGGECIPAYVSADGALLPLVATQEGIAATLAPIAQGLANESGTSLTLRRYSSMTVMASVDPVATDG